MSRPPQKKPQPPKKANPPPVPVLTEVVETDPASIPTLTEIHPGESALLSDVQCRQLAAQIAPQIDALIQEATRGIKAQLPELIRSAMNKQPSK